MITVNENVIKIETYWNVNLIQKRLGHIDMKIKIETYWNVNLDDEKRWKYIEEIKIETYWNVNSNGRPLLSCSDQLKQKHIGM